MSWSIFLLRCLEQNSETIVHSTLACSSRSPSISWCCSQRLQNPDHVWPLPITSSTTTESKPLSPSPVLYQFFQQMLLCFQLCNQSDLEERQVRSCIVTFEHPNQWISKWSQSKFQTPHKDSVSGFCVNLGLPLVISCKKCAML